MDPFLRIGTAQNQQPSLTAGRVSLMLTLFLLLVLRAEFPAKVKRDVLSRAKSRCEITGRVCKGHIDHILSLRSGGNSNIINAIYLSPRVHDYKHQIVDGFSPAKKYGWQLDEPPLTEEEKQQIYNFCLDNFLI